MASLKIFSYNSLPNNSSIRILELTTESGVLQKSVESYNRFDPKDVIKGKLLTTDLNDELSYDALSYTWGDPLGVYHSKDEAEKAVRMHQAKVPIICNDCVLEVGANLHDALLMLRAHLRSSSHTLRNLHPDLEPRPLVQKCIWIDAICIDQTNLLERNHQVNVMDKIYRNANAVLIWLGPGDDFCRSAAQALTVLAKTPLERAKNFSLSQGLKAEDDPNPDALAITPGQWLSIYAFFERRWFRRAWIIQETVLARIGIVFCGTLVLPWAALVRAVYWMRESMVYPKIWEAGAKASIEFFTEQSGMYRPSEMQHNSDPSAVIFSIADVRGGLKLPDVGISIKSSAAPTNPLNVLSQFRRCECFDPRDKVYAFLSFWPNWNRQTETGDILVDYNKSVAEVYTDFARFILLSSRNLRLLSHVEARTRRGNLPSWVPDWSQDGSIKPFDTQIWLSETRHNRDGEIPFNAAGDDERSPSLIPNLNSNCLAVQAIKIGAISATARFDRHDLTKVLPILSEMPVMYPYFKISGLEDGNPLVGTVPADISETLVRSMRHLTMNERGSVPEISEVVVPSNVSSGPAKAITSKHKVIDIYKQTRFEALWRTIIADVWNFEHPAPRDAGFAFIGSLVDDMLTLLSRGERLLNSTTMIHPYGASGLVLDMLEAVVGETGTSFEEIDLAWRKRITILQALAEDEKMCLNHYRGDSHEEPERYLPDITTSEDILNYEYDVNAAQRWRVHERPHRLLFTTSTHKIGLAPLTAKSEDEVWVLKGARFPFILRRLDNGHHILVGEAYVHGIMHGEVRWFGGQDFEEVTLE